MGRPKRQSGSTIIAQAEMLFVRSVEAGKPDFRYVALAIGATPQSPPDWAMLACIELRRDTDGQPGRGNSSDIEGILDGIVRFYDRCEQEHEQRVRQGSSAPSSYRPPSLRSAIRSVAAGKRDDHANGNDDWCRDIRCAWEHEQEFDLAPHSLFQFEQDNIPKNKRWLHTTARIDRVMREAVADELDHPLDVETWAWVTKKLIENEEMAKINLPRQKI